LWVFVEDLGFADAKRLYGFLSWVLEGACVEEEEEEEEEWQCS
jgi:hypothetical protein